MSHLHELFVSTHKKLQELLKEELMILRSLFDLMIEEEIAFLKNKGIAKENLKEEKSETSKKLKLIQKQRHQVTQSLLHEFAVPKRKEHFNSQLFNQIVSKDQENSVETFHLRDQVLNFIEKIEKQKEINHTLKGQNRSYDYPAQLKKAEVKPKRKNNLETLEE
jgi:hypothetical protein